MCIQPILVQQLRLKCGSHAAHFNVQGQQSRLIRAVRISRPQQLNLREATEDLIDLVILQDEAHVNCRFVLQRHDLGEIPAHHVLPLRLGRFDADLLSFEVVLIQSAHVSA